jgi:hypothetical protein
MCSCLQDKGTKHLECMGVDFNIIVDTWSIKPMKASSTHKIAEECFVSWSIWSPDHFSACTSTFVGAKAWQIHTCECHTDHSSNSPPLDFCHLFLYYLCILWLVLLILSIFFAPNFLVREPNSYKWFWN